MFPDWSADDNHRLNRLFRVPPSAKPLFLWVVAWTRWARPSCLLRRLLVGAVSLDALQTPIDVAGLACPDKGGDPTNRYHRRPA